MRFDWEQITDRFNLSKEVLARVMKWAVRASRPQPEMFEDVVRFVVFAAIETRKKTRVVRVEVSAGFGAERSDVGGNAVVFFHRVSDAANLSIPALCKTRSV